MKRYTFCLWLICALLALCGCSETKESEPWPTSGLGTMISEPKEGIVDIRENTDKEFRAVIYADKHKNKDQEKIQSIYDELYDELYALGFTLDQRNDEGTFIAFNSDGYKVELSPNRYLRVSVSLFAPKRMDSITWPNSKGADLIPYPDSMIGEVEGEGETYFNIYFGNTTREQFNSYVDKLIDAGFNIDYNKSNGWFQGKNAIGGSVTLEYYGFNTMYMHYKYDEERGQGKSVSEETADSTKEEPDEPNLVAEEESEEKTEEATEQKTSEAKIDETGTENKASSVSDEINQHIKDGTSVSDAFNYLEKIGYKATFTAENSGDDFTDAIYDVPEMRDGFVVKSVENIDDTKKTVDIWMLGIETIKDEEERKNNHNALVSKLESWAAWDAAEGYGREMYGDDFKVKYLTVMAEEPEDEDTWFLKAKCSYKVNGKKVEKTVEARVTGTTDDPKVKTFNVY